jgi:dolichyl-phosphate beta-glucosyltransferase
MASKKPGPARRVKRSQVRQPKPVGAAGVEVSIVIPVFNGQRFIRENIAVLQDFCRSHFSSHEIIVVDDGSRDETREILESLPKRNLKVIGLDTNRGKFGALAAGMAQARGRCRLFTDADLPYDLDALPYIVKLVNDRDLHIIIGDRNLPQSVYDINTNWLRNISTKIFSFFVYMMVTGGLFDTQCGLKGFRADVAEGLFPLVTDWGFSGDVELLYIALKYNLEIKRIPVRLESHGPSTVRLFSQALRMLGRVSQLRLNWNRGIYASQKLKDITSQDYWHKD